MRKPFIIASIVVSIVGLAALGWRTFVATPKPAPQPPRQPVVARPTSPSRKPIPQPPGQPIVARPTPPKKHLAPEGVYFLVARVYIPSASGGTGLSPGTQVTLVSSNGSISTVTDGDHNFQIDSSQLTNDLDIAARVSKTDAVTQNKIAGSIAKSIQEHEKQEQDKIAALDQEEKDRERRHTPAPRTPNPLDRGAYIKR
jgi:hypothetical protein